MGRMKLNKVSKYVIGSTMLTNALLAPVTVFAAESKPDQTVLQSAIKELLDKGIISGDSNGELNLGSNLTRMQVASILARALNLNLHQISGSSFTDVSSDSWGIKYVEALYQLGIMVGSNGEFRPNDVLTKEELAVILVRITQTNIIGKGNNLSFSDADSISNWARPFVQAAIESGLLSLNNGAFEGQRLITRDEVFVIANSFIQSPVFGSYKEKINTLYNTGKKVTNSDPTV